MTNVHIQTKSKSFTFRFTDHRDPVVEGHLRLGLGRSPTHSSVDLGLVRWVLTHLHASTSHISDQAL